MKKVLLSTVAAGLAFAAMPAHADIDLELGGFAMAYGAFVDQDEKNGEVNDFDLVKETELHVSGETTLDNGLTVGMHAEFNVDGADGSAGNEESYLYMSGSWGRVNVGEEDGAAYLLQVAAPSADSNVDGLRSYIDGVNETVLVDSGYTFATTVDDLEYDQAPTGATSKLTYLSPVVSGFQLGLSFTPDGDAAVSGSIGTDNTSTLGNNGVYGEAYEAAVRYEGEFEGVGIAAGAGYSNIQLEDYAAGVTPVAGDISDDRTVWNAGLDLDFGPFGVGVVYKEDDHGEVKNAANTGSIDDEEIFVVGVDYTTGPFKLGASFYDSENVDGNEDLDANRYVGGVTYTYGPGMTLRGSVSYVEFEDTNIGGTNDDEVDATSFLIGTKVKF